MKAMDRALQNVQEKYPKHIVSTTISGNNGITYSMEASNNLKEGFAECEVLKAILNRENYLSKLLQIARTIGRKFKPELADVLDLLRKASLDVIDLVIRWREVKDDHDAAFTWNGINYLLKMPSDCDFLADYLAIKSWMGFSLIRNPFCVPFPMEESAGKTFYNLTDPQHIAKGKSVTDGFIIGGMSLSRLRKKYTKSVGKSTHFNGPSDSASFVYNDDMIKIRQAELVILREEEKFGVLTKDPGGRLMPRLQALTRIAHIELKKDDMRSLTNPAQTLSYAPHAMNSDVGVAKPSWTPDVVNYDLQSSDNRKGIMPNMCVSDFDEVDVSVLPLHRGKGKLGGILAPTNVRGVPSRSRRPQRNNLSSDMEFRRDRSLRTLGVKLAQIDQLRDAILVEKAKRVLVDNDQRIVSNKTEEVDISVAMLSPVVVIQNNLLDNRTEITRSMVSNNTISPLNTIRKDANFLERSNSASGIVLSSADKIEPKSQDVTSKLSSPLRGIRKIMNNSGCSSLQVESAVGKMKDFAGEKSTPKVNFRKSASVEKTEYSIVSEYPLSGIKPPLISGSCDEVEWQAKEIRQLDNLDIEIRQKFNHFLRDEEKIVLLKEMEKDQCGKEHSRQIERKRRLLSEKGGRRVGPPPEDSRNVYDYYAIRVQSVIRGFLARCWLRWYITVSLKACKVLQAAMRGWFGRMRVRKIRREFRAANDIQRNFRGWSTRGTSSAMAKRQNLAKNAVVIQRVWRGILGVRRCISKRALDVAAKAAFECVDAKSITIGDVKELARRILYAIEEPSATSFPPDEVLYLIRLSVMVIQSARGNLGLACYDFFNARSYDELSGDELSWLQAAKMVNRSERFMRLVRVMAYGPGAKPPRLVQLPNNANLLYAAQAQNPRWTLSTFETMGAGSKICCQLFRWLTSIIEIAGRQQEFLSLIATSFPDWLPKLYDFQKSARINEFEIELNKKCLSVLELFKARSMDDDTLLSVLDKEILLVKRASNDARGHMKDILMEIDKLKNDQSSREVYAMLATEQKLVDNNAELDEMAKKFQNAFRLAGQGDRAAIEKIAELKVQLTNQRLKVTELDGQRKLLEMQVEMNRSKRKNPARLTSDITARVLLAGEAKAAFIMAQVRTRTMLRSAGVKHSEDLPVHLVDIHDELLREEELCRSEARRLLVEAEIDRKAYDDFVSRSLSENEMKEQKSKDKMSPTEQELQEERAEDEAEAKSERLKHKQYLPDSVLLVHQSRPRPVIIALSRDLPMFAKSKIHDEVTRFMPGLFVTVDCPNNMGIDFRSIQCILDSGKSVLMSVDHGLTRVSRDSFLQNLEININALIPTPFVVLAVGDEQNRRGGCAQRGGVCLGVNKNDLPLLRDCDIKVCLEGMSWVAWELDRPEIRKACQKIASELMPHSKVFSFVLEAFFIVLSKEDVYKSFDIGVVSVTWRATRAILLEPKDVVQKLRLYRRGSTSVRLCEVVRTYTLHSCWPQPYGDDRSRDELLNLLAYYVEQWLLCETLTAAGDGAPLNGLSKSTMRNIQAVVVVTDTIDPDDNAVESKHICGWRIAASKLVRAALQDLCVLKFTSKIDKQLFNISVYREKGTVYLEAYNPHSSDLQLTCVQVEDIPALLIPNGYELSIGGIVTPQSPHEMYLALVKLLRFDYSKRQHVLKELVCRRQNAFLRNINRRISGHLLLVKSFEAALGEMFFVAYLPEYSAKLKLMIADNVRLRVFKNANPDCPSGEYQFADSEDGRPMLPFLLDRLRISPSVTMSCARGIDLNDGFRIKQGLRGDVERLGFSLKIRTVGGAGRILARRVHSFYGVPHIFEVRVSTYSQVLMVFLYEPRQRKTLKLTISPYLRSLLLPEISDDVTCWLTPLLRRLSVDWRGNFRIVLNQCLYRVSKKIGAKHLVVRLLAIDDTESVQLTLFDPTICETYSCVITKEQVISLLEYVPNNQRGHSNSDDSIKNIINAADISSTKNLESDCCNILSSLNRQSLLSILKCKQALVLLTNQLGLLLEPVDPSKLLFGYVIRKEESLSLKLDLDSAVKVSQGDELNVSLRYSSRLKSIMSDGSYAGVWRCRHQQTVVSMEDELNSLALLKSQHADLQKNMDVIAAKKVEEHLQTLEDTVLKNSVIQDAIISTTTNLLDTIQDRLVVRFAERSTPGLAQSHFEESVKHGTPISNIVPEIADLMPILSNEWSKVFEAGVKTNFREGKVRWQGHVSVKISETNCWIGEDGTGKRYKFEVFEPKVAQTFEGLVRSKKHLIEILGLHGQDLLHYDRVREMLLFVCKHRMDVVVNKKTWDGEDVEEGAPPYRIEFQCDKLYGSDKVTPVDKGGDDDEAANKEKLLDMDNARGKKIVRLVRRVSGLIMQLTVFDIPDAIVAASEEERVRQQKTKPFDFKQITAVKSDDAIHCQEDQKNTVDAGFAEQRTRTQILKKFSPPAFRIVGYDPRSKRKVTLTVEPQAIVEVSGGVFSPYLDPNRKKELARIVCDAMVLVFPSGRPFEMLIPWSGAKKDISAAITVTGEAKLSMRPSAERVVKRPGRIFRSAMRISKYDLLVSLYSHAGSNMENSECYNSGASNSKQLIFNFYSPAVSEAVDVTVSEEEQVARVGRPILSVSEGTMRAAIVRRLCQFFRCEIIEDILDSKVKTMHVVLMHPHKGYLTDYQMVTAALPGEDVRPVGIPAVFFPLDTCGRVVHRRGMALICRNRAQPNKDFLVTVYTKSFAENVERGLVVKLYDRSNCSTSVLHLGASELMRLCQQKDEPDLLRDLVRAKSLEESEAQTQHDLDKGFADITVKGELEAATQILVERVVEIVLCDIGYLLDAQDQVVPYLRSAPRGVPPT